MTTRVVTDDQRRPTAEEIAVFTRRLSELLARFLKGVLDVDAVLGKLQEAMELTRGFINCNVQPEIPDWADQQNPIIRHISCGTIDSSRIIAADVFLERETFLDGKDYITRAQKVPGAMNACAFDLYAKSENWKYLPKDVEILVFPMTEFCHLDGRRCVRYLCRYGARWSRVYDWLDDRFDRYYRVAALASPLGLEAKLS